MSFDGIVTGAIAQELSKCLSNGKIEKIYQPESDEILLHVHAGREKYKLYLSTASSHARVHLTENAEYNPPSPTAFCMLLRKHIQGGRLAHIEQKESERILEFSIDTINELGFSVNKKLIVEIMGKHSNIILIDIASNRIIDSMKRISIDVNRYRQTLPGLEYVYPPSQEKQNCYTITQKEFCTGLRSTSVSMSKALLQTVQGISPILAADLCHSAMTEYKTSEELLTPEQIFPVFHRMVDRISKNCFSPVVYRDAQGNILDFHVFPLCTLSDDCRETTFESASKAVDYFYNHKASSNRIKQKSTDLYRTVETILAKLCLKKQRLSEDLLKAGKADTQRLYGELLMANLHLVKPGAESVTVTNYYDGKPLKISLDQRISPAKNSQRYYKLYAKSKTAVKEKNLQLSENQLDINYLESVLTFIEQASSYEELENLRQELVELSYLKKKKQTGKPVKSKMSPHNYTSSDGFRISAGKNNKENDYLTFKTTEKRDLWFHTKDIPGSHVILYTEGREASEIAIFEAASIAAYHSKGQQSENVPVDYVPVRYVKKPNGAKPGMVIFTDNHTVYVNPKLPENK